jgi:DNA-binding beta-propeller fold protein YncE
MMRPFHTIWALPSLLVLAGTALADFAAFESPPVHPLELSPDGRTLFAAHSHESRLVLFDLSGAQLVRSGEIPVGLEPVTVRARSNEEVWVLNHLSDSVSIAKRLPSGEWHVTATLLVGDEPTDVAFAGSPERAFVVLSQEDRIAVYDPANLSMPPTSIELMASDPRSIAVSPDGHTLYLTALEGGNRTTALGGLPAPAPALRAGLPAPPPVALIVQHDGVGWRDEFGGSWDAGVAYQLLDNDVLVIDAATQTVVDVFSDVGTNLFNVAIIPTTGALLVSNQAADNLTRFLPNLAARFVQNQITEIFPGSGVVTAHHLNSHIDYSTPTGNAGERALSLAFPLDLAVASTGNVAYVAAFSSAKVGVLDGSGTVVDRWAVGNGPAGLALDEMRNRLYILNAIDATISVLQTSDGSTTRVHDLGYDATPAEIVEGRRLFYDAENSSGHGDLSCNSCHLFTGVDNIAWDLGNPLGDMEPAPPQPFPLPPVLDFHPMKGPMVTQSLKGLQGTEPLHWRGDQGALADFNPAFEDLLGRTGQLGLAEFGDLEAFIMSLRYPPNPFQELDGGLPPVLGGASPLNGESLYLTGGLVGGLNCVSCHALPTGENGTIIVGSLLLEPEGKVVPQLRNMYEKTRFDNEASFTLRGFGYTHDGASDDLVSFLQFPAFNFASDAEREDVAAFLMTFDTGTPAAVGAQWTMDGSNEAAGIGRLTTLQGLADGNAIGLVAKGRDPGGIQRGWAYVGGSQWTPDRAAEPVLSTARLLALAGAQTEVTFTGVVEGCEWRLGVDRDEDGFRDGDERDVNADPADPASTPVTVPTGAEEWLAGSESRIWLAGPNPAAQDAQIGYRVGISGSVDLAVYDLRGRRVRQLMSKRSAIAGSYLRRWDLRDQSGHFVPSGVYFVRLALAERILSTRLTVVK